MNRADDMEKRLNVLQLAVLIGLFYGISCNDCQLYGGKYDFRIYYI